MIKGEFCSESLASGEGSLEAGRKLRGLKDKNKLMNNKGKGNIKTNLGAVTLKTNTYIA